MLLIYANRHCSLETVFRMLTFQSIFAICLFGDGFAGDWGKHVVFYSPLFCPGNESLFRKLDTTSKGRINHGKVVFLDRFKSSCNYAYQSIGHGRDFFHKRIEYSIPIRLSGLKISYFSICLTMWCRLGYIRVSCGKHAIFANRVPGKIDVVEANIQI